ncbi:hypothetical protein CUMW_255620 [Citrus unshiu]|uniref:Anaphase-promoting complex subunit 4 WD40 domain-containing protein n=1 Tax=Citrus unshiu TaxID=55188 RepID=A0A2H5QRT2_CITUN|nr:hypothetical protein CUMW_255620 [Citrus unshiu]
MTFEQIFENTIFIKLKTLSCFIHSHIKHHCVILYIVRGKTNFLGGLLSGILKPEKLGGVDVGEVGRTTSNKLYSGSRDGTVRVWDCESGQCVKIINNGAEIGCLICEGSWVFIGLPNAVKAWRVNTANNDCDEAFVLDGPIGQVNALVVYNDLLFAGSEDGAIRVWNLEDLECVQTLCGGHSDAVMSLLFWDEYLFSCSLEKTIKI